MPERARTRSHAKARKRSDEAPRHCGSLGGKCDADIAVGERAEDRVDQRVQRDVGVGMSGDAARMRDAHAAEHDVIAVAEGVHVETAAGAHIAERRHAAALRRARNRPRVVSFTLLLSPAKTLTGWPAHSASAASSVKSSRPAAAARAVSFDDERR